MWVWVDRWVQVLGSGHPGLGPGVVLDPSRSVSSFIDAQSQSWLVEEMDGLVAVDDRRGIIDTPIGALGHWDCLA